MPFKHKLSRRLALLKDALVVVSLSALACEQPIALNEPAPTLRLQVTPKAVTLPPNGSAQLTAVALTSAGDTANIDVNWSVTSGSIIDTSTSNGRHYGRYKAGADTGKFKVIAHGKWASGSGSDTATVTVDPPPVASVSVTPAVLSLLVGTSTQLTATTKDSAGNVLSGRTILWSSGNAAVAGVSGSGLVTAVAAGAATITATSEGQSGTSAVTATSTPVASVSVTPPSAYLQVGQTVQLSATPKDANGNPLSGRVVTWTSGTPAVATVSGGGLVTGITQGPATITATSEGQSGASAITVGNVPVASVSVTPAAASVLVGQTVQLTATPKDANGNPLSGRVVTWSSNNTAVASVNSSGLVSGVAVGPATVTATSEGQSASSAITVSNVPVASVAVSPASASVPVGQTAQLTATPKDANGSPLSGRVVTWSSNSTSVASVNSSGLVIGVAVGSATVTATSEGQSGSSAITVTQVPVASVAVTPVSAGIQVGQTVQLTATPKDGNGNPLSGRVVTWASNNTAVATVSASGLVTGKVAGSATITATSEGQSGSSAITVTQVPVASVAVTPASASIQVGQTGQLTATPKDASGNTLSGRAVTWSSSNSGVAGVNSSGLVTGVALGAATITATSEGKSGTAAVTVTAPPPPSTGSCLNQSGPSMTISGLHTSEWSNTSLADNTKVDATTAQWLLGPSQLGTYVYLGGGSGLCWSGGQVMAQDPPSFPYEGNYHDIYGLNVHAAGVTVENVRVFTGGDGITFDDQGSANWTVRGMYIRYMRDDCIENDFLNSGLIDDVLAEGCYTFVSSRTYTGSPDGTNNTVTVQNSLVWLEQMDAIYPSLTAPGSGGFWKWVGSGWPNNGNGPSLVVNNTVFRADAAPVEGEGAGEYFAPPKLKSCANNVMVWLGAGSLPRSLPSCFTVMTGSAGLDYWKSKVAAWKAAHPAGPDVAPPIVSLWAVPSTLNGTVTLEATAVDDQTIAGVQFQLNGQAIGSEVLPDQVDKAHLSWDSRTKPNGSYTLTATARDAAGHSQTSAGISVTISN